MKTLIVLFNLKAGVAAADYEAWATSVDVPTVSRLASVNDFRLLRTSGLLGSDAPAPYQYVETLEVDNLEALFADIGSPTMQKVAAEFATFADAPQFMVCDRVK